MSLVEMKDFNVLRKNKSFFEQPTNKNIWKSCRNVRNKNYVTENLLDHLYHKKCYNSLL